MYPSGRSHVERFLQSSACIIFLSIFCTAKALIPGNEPKIFVRSNASEATERGSGCQVLFLAAHEDASLPGGAPLDLGRFDALLTNAHDLVPWASVSGPLHFIDTSEYPQVPFRELFERKRFKRTVSILVPQQAASPEIVQWTQEAFAQMPGDVYVDDGTPASRKRAFEAYAFSVLLSSVDSGVPPPAVLEAVAHATVPLLVWTVPHFINYTVYFPYAVGKFKPGDFSPAFAYGYINAVHDDAIYVFQNSLMLVQDFFSLRYNLPFSRRMRILAERLCDDAALPPGLRTDVFVAIYSAKANFARRRAARETWLGLLEQPISLNGGSIAATYKFFVNAVGAGDPADPATSQADDALRAEFDIFGDVIFLEAVEEYPIGNMGRLALRWIANHTTAPYILKLDDDMYIRPLPLLQHLVRQQRAMMYWGFFERSGEVIRDPANKHFLPPELYGHDGVFPPYARGAALALSLDLVRLIAHFDRLGSLLRLKIEDASYGYYIWQLVSAGLTTVTLADRDERHFSLDPKCCTERSHPNNCWSPLSDATWLVHHVGPRAVRCMWRTDREAGYYNAEAQARPLVNTKRCHASEALSLFFPGDDSSGGHDAAPHPCDPVRKVGPAFDPTAYDPKRTWPLPSLCGCVATPPPHPGRPIPGPLYEGPEGPRLHVHSSV